RCLLPPRRSRRSSRHRYRGAHALPPLPTRRSSDLHAHLALGAVVGVDHALGGHTAGLLGGGGQAALTQQLDGLGKIALGVGQSLDRKSTRLNSSHVSSSYAVFCLKKKRTRIRGPAR